MILIVWYHTAQYSVRYCTVWYTVQYRTIWKYIFGVVSLDTSVGGYARGKGHLSTAAGGYSRRFGILPSVLGPTRCGRLRRGFDVRRDCCRSAVSRASRCWCYFGQWASFAVVDLTGEKVRFSASPTSTFVRVYFFWEQIDCFWFTKFTKFTHEGRQIQ